MKVTVKTSAALALTLFGASILMATQASAQESRPECVYQSTDFDGDGFGYENNTTCVITDNSSGVVPASNECIDDNADGWGWNGVESCAVPIPENDSGCVDTDPIGDGWGWDGITSCRVVPEQQESDELEELRNHIRDVPITLPDNTNRAAVISCPPGFGPYYLSYNGSLYAEGLRASGLWSSGMSSTDSRLKLLIANNGRAFTLTLLVTSEGVWEGSTQRDSNQCQWLD